MGNASLEQPSSPQAARSPRAWWGLALGAGMLGLAAVVFDQITPDLLCRYGQSRWDPSKRDCYVPLPDPAEAPSSDTHGQPAPPSTGSALRSQPAGR